MAMETVAVIIYLVREKVFTHVVLKFILLRRFIDIISCIKQVHLSHAWSLHAVGCLHKPPLTSQLYLLVVQNHLYRSLLFQPAEVVAPSQLYLMQKRSFLLHLHHSLHLLILHHRILNLMNNLPQNQITICGSISLWVSVCLCCSLFL